MLYKRPVFSGVLVAVQPFFGGATRNGMYIRASTSYGDLIDTKRGSIKYPDHGVQGNCGDISPFCRSIPHPVTWQILASNCVTIVMVPYGEIPPKCVCCLPLLSQK